MTGPGKTRFQVTFAFSIEKTVEVEADSPQDALALVNRADYPLPELNQWERLEEWSWVVYDEDGDELLTHENAGPGTTQWQPEEDTEDTEEDALLLLQGASARG